jgi:hypothetical protein
VLNQPGTLPDDNIEPGAVSVANMEGAYKTYYWNENGGPAFDENPPGANIILLNLKSDRKPFALIPPPPYDYDLVTSFPGHGRNSRFNWWDHWPVSQDASDGRDALGTDRPSHSSLCHLGLQRDHPVDCRGSDDYVTWIKNGSLEWTVGEWSELIFTFDKPADLNNPVLISFDYADLWTSSVSIKFIDTDGGAKEILLDEFISVLVLNQPAFRSFSKKISLSDYQGDARLSDIRVVSFRLSAKEARKTLKLDNLKFTSITSGTQSLDYSLDFDLPDGTHLEEINTIKHAGWEPYTEGGDSITKLMLHGLTSKGIPYLATLAQSWSNPPKLELSVEGYESLGYDPEQMAYVIRQDENRGQSLTFNIGANNDSPLVNPAFVIRNWGASEISLQINGNLMTSNEDFRTGHVETLDDTYLVLWIKMTSDEKNTFLITPIEK